MTDQERRDLLQWVVEQERKRLLENPPAPKPDQEWPSIHWTELKEDTSDDRGAPEWNFYLKQVGRLLAEGQEGRWAAIKGEEIVGIWDTKKEADEARLQRFPNDIVLLKEICEREPLLRCGVYVRPRPPSTLEDRKFLEMVVEQERKRLLENPPAPKPPPEPPSIHWTELKEDTSDRRGAADWNCYVKNIGRLLAEGHEGRWVLIHGAEITGIWDTEKEANEVRWQRFPMQGVLLKQIFEKEPILRGGGYHRIWRT
jgi:hypothetical protein